MKAWGFTNLQRTVLSAAIDIATFDAPVSGFDDDTALQPAATVKIYRDGIKWFEGVVTQTPLTATPGAEFQGYIISGPWYHFENNVFKQAWNTVAGTVYLGHLLLNVTSGQALIDTSTQMIAICDWLISLFPGTEPFQKGTIDPVAYPPISEINTITCAAAMRSQLRWIQDAVAWFDYSTSPPTLHVRQRSNLTAVSVAIPDQDMAACSIVPRYDLQRPSVAIFYEIVSQVNGVNRYATAQDIYPPSATGNEPGSYNLNVNLQGPVRNVSFASLLCEDIDTSSVAWWQSKIPGLKDTRVANIEVSNVTRLLSDDTPSQQLPRELIEGQITEWMGFDWEQEVITGKVTYEVYDRNASDPDKITLGKLVQETFSINLVSTDATTGDFQNVTTSDTGDPLPSNLAQFLYDALAVLHYDGQFSLVEEEITGQVGIGNKVNLTGGRVAWQTMDAIVQSITEDVDTGTTQVTIGPPKHLGHDDLMELLRVGRRFRWTQAATQETGELGDAGLIKFGKPTANRNSLSVPKQYELHRVQDRDTATTAIKLDAVNKVLTIEQASGRSVQIDLNDITSNAPAAAMPIKLREHEVCVSGVTYRMVTLSSAPYVPPP